MLSGEICLHTFTLTDLDSVDLGCQSEVVYDLTRSVKIRHALVQEPEHRRSVLHKSDTELLVELVGR